MKSDRRIIFVLRGADAFDRSRFIPLCEALERKCVVVHETADVGQLETENLSDVLDPYVQAGDRSICGQVSTWNITPSISGEQR